MSTHKMTEISWTQEDLRREHPTIKTLGELISTTSQRARDNGEFVCAVTVNGMTLTEEQESQFESAGINEITHFSIKIQTLGVLLDESMNQCGAFLRQLISSVEVAAEMFRAEDINAAHRFYRTCIEGTQLFVEMLAHYKVVYQSNFGPCPASWAEFEKSLTSYLLQILEAFKQKNYILIADLLEYELSPVLARWEEELAKKGERPSGSENRPENFQGPTA